LFETYSALKASPAEYELFNKGSQSFTLTGEMKFYDWLTLSKNLI